MQTGKGVQNTVGFTRVLNTINFHYFFKLKFLLFNIQNLPTILKAIY